MIGTEENRAVLQVEVVFWSGSRRTMPPNLASGRYCPHLVVRGSSAYLGVCFLDGTECAFDRPARGNIRLLYPDTVDYSLLADHAEFLIVEGQNPVVKGRVLGRSAPFETGL